MTKKNAFAGFLLIGIGAYFLLRQLKIPFFVDFYSWPTLLIIVGAALLLHAYLTKDYQNLFAGAFIIGLGLHFHGLAHYSFWTHSWGVYPFLAGAAFLVRALKTKKGYLIGIVLLAIGLFVIMTDSKPAWFSWIDRSVAYATQFWPVILIAVGAIILFGRKK